MTDYLLKSAVSTFITTLFCVWLLQPMAVQVGLTDSPEGRKRHINETPLIGGIAIFFSFCFGLLTLHTSLNVYRGLFSGWVFVIWVVLLLSYIVLCNVYLKKHVDAHC